MHAHTPPFTKPPGAYDASRLTAREAYDQTSAVAASQDAKLAITPAERDAKLRTVAHYIYHAKLLMDEVFAEERSRSNAALAELAREAQADGFYASADITAKWSPQWLVEQGIPAESSYLASFSPNDLQAETLREYGIGDVARHPMHAEALRLADEPPEDKL